MFQGIERLEFWAPTNIPKADSAERLLRVDSCHWDKSLVGQEQSVSAVRQISQKRSFALVLFHWEAREEGGPAHTGVRRRDSVDSSPRFPAAPSDTYTSSASIRLSFCTCERSNKFAAVPITGKRAVGGPRVTRSILYETTPLTNAQFASCPR